MSEPSLVMKHKTGGSTSEFRALIAWGVVALVNSTPWIGLPWDLVTLMGGAAGGWAALRTYLKNVDLRMLAEKVSVAAEAKRNEPSS